jgi:hypothetical protein
MSLPYMVKYELVPCSLNYDHYISVSYVESLVRDENFVRIRAGIYTIQYK